MPTIICLQGTGDFLTLEDAFAASPDETRFTLREGRHDFPKHGWPSTLTLKADVPPDSEMLRNMMIGAVVNNPESWKAWGYDKALETRMFLNMGEGMTLDQGQRWLFRNIHIHSEAEQQAAIIRLSGGASFEAQHGSIICHNPRYDAEPRQPPSPALRAFEVEDATLSLTNCIVHSDGDTITVRSGSSVRLRSVKMNGHGLRTNANVLALGGEIEADTSFFWDKVPFIVAGEAKVNLSSCYFNGWHAAVVRSGQLDLSSCESVEVIGDDLVAEAGASITATRCTFEHFAASEAAKLPPSYVMTSIGYAPMKPELEVPSVGILNKGARSIRVVECVFDNSEPQSYEESAP